MNRERREILVKLTGKEKNSFSDSFGNKFNYKFYPEDYQILKPQHGFQNQTNSTQQNSFKHPAYQVI